MYQKCIQIQKHSIKKLFANINIQFFIILIPWKKIEKSCIKKWTVAQLISATDNNSKEKKLQKLQHFVELFNMW